MLVFLDQAYEQIKIFTVAGGEQGVGGRSGNFSGMTPPVSQAKIALHPVLCNPNAPRISMAKLELLQEGTLTSYHAVFETFFDVHPRRNFWPQ